MTLCDCASPSDDPGNNRLRCARCGQDVDPDDVFITPGPARIGVDEIPALSMLCEGCMAEVKEWTEEEPE